MLAFPLRGFSLDRKIIYIGTKFVSCVIDLNRYCLSLVALPSGLRLLVSFTQSYTHCKSLNAYATAGVWGLLGGGGGWRVEGGIEITLVVHSCIQKEET